MHFITKRALEFANICCRVSNTLRFKNVSSDIIMKSSGDENTSGFYFMDYNNFGVPVK